MQKGKNMSDENDNVEDQNQEDQAQSQNDNDNVQVEERQQAPGADEVSPEERAGQVDHIMAMAEKDPSIKDLPEYKEMLKEIEAAESKTQANTGDDDDNDSDSNNSDDDSSGKGKGKENATDDDDDNDGDEDDDIDSGLSDEDDVFGLNKGKKGKTKYKFKDEKDVVKLIQKKGFKEMPTFFDSVDKWRNDSQELGEVRTQNDSLIEGLGSLPQPIKEAIQAFSQNEDWQTAFQNQATSLNFDTDFKELDKEAVVKHYFKKKYEGLKERLDADSLSEEDFEERITDFYESSERLFNSDKQTVESKRAAVIKQETANQERFKESALSSVKSLSKEYPNFKASQLKKIRQHLVNGDVNSLFQNEEGYLNDAAERIAFALYGKAILKTRIERATKDGASGAKEKFFQRGNKNPKTQNSQQGFSGSQANEATSHLKGQFKDDPYA